MFVKRHAVFGSLHELTLCPYSTSWYKPGQSWGAVLGEVSSSLEECRAETVALYRKYSSWTFFKFFLLRRFAVVSNPDILKIFNVSHETTGYAVIN